MTKRKRKLQLRLADMPQLVDSLAVDIDSVDEPVTPETVERIAQERADGTKLTVAEVEQERATDLRDLRAGLDAAELWWVAEPMSLLAQAAAPDMPAWDWDAIRPSPSGVVVWEGSTGISIDVGDKRELWQGVLWSPYRGNTVVVPLVRAEEAIAPTRSRGLALSAMSWVLAGTAPRSADQAGAEDSVHATKPPARRLDTMLATTLTLAQQPTIVTRHEHTGGERMLDGRGPHLPVTVTQVVLRETVKDAADVERAEEGDAKWHLKTRFLVRGHWRQQAVGPGRKLRRPTYIAPFLKGPDGAPFRETTAVNVWRR